jgi:hypothetical protein
MGWDVGEWRDGDAGTGEVGGGKAQEWAWGAWVEHALFGWMMEMEVDGVLAKRGWPGYICHPGWSGRVCR